MVARRTGKVTRKKERKKGGGGAKLTPPFNQMTISFGVFSAEVGKNQKNMDEPLLAAPTGSDPAKEVPTSKSTSGIEVPLTTNSVQGGFDGVRSAPFRFLKREEGRGLAY